MKKLITVMNMEIPFGRALNAAAHTTLGMGHRIPAGFMPMPRVYIGTKQQTYAFRQAAYKIYTDNPATTLYADFCDTMIHGTTDEQLQRTRMTQQNDLEYFAVSICIDEENIILLEQVMRDLTTLPNYLPEIRNLNANFEFSPVYNLPDNHDPIYQPFHTHRAALAFNKKREIGNCIDDMIIACIELGRKIDITALHLLMYLDGSDEVHPNISYHAFPIITAKNQNKLDAIASEVEQNSDLVSSITKDGNGIISVVSFFGVEQTVNLYSKQCSLWNREILQDACEKYYCKQEQN